MSDPNIFEALRESHERQRDLCRRVTDTSGDTPERRELFVRKRWCTTSTKKSTASFRWPASS